MTIFEPRIFRWVLNLGEIRAYIYAYIYTHTYIYICVCVCSQCVTIFEPRIFRWVLDFGEIHASSNVPRSVRDRQGSGRD